MQKHTRSRQAMLYFLILLMLISGCGGAPQASGEDETEVTIAVSGAWALYPMMVRWAEEYEVSHPGVQFDISAGGAGKGMADVLSDMVDIGMVSREIRPEEEAQGANGIAVAKDAVFPTINVQNPALMELMASGITQEIFAGIYIRGDITTWGQVLGDPAITDPLHVYTRSDACGAAEVWAKYLGGMQEDLLGIGVFSDPGILEAVINDALGLGYNNLNYAFDPHTGEPVLGSVVVPVDINGDGRVDDGELLDTKEKAIEAVSSGNYPSPPARVLYLVTNGQPSGAVLDFLNWVLNEGQAFLGEAGYISLAESQLNVERDKLH